ncbi:MAG TPA: tetratricopeptide repeat protein [Planctomycetaceae bacterium]
MDNASPASSVPPSPALAGERVAFTGTLASMTHRQAQERVADNGGTAAEHVSRQTTMLVIGEEGWPLEPDGKPSVKLQHAERLNVEGLDIRIVRESEWLGFVGLDGRRGELHRRCTPAMLSRMLDISVHEIRRWERMGLIKAVAHVCRLPFFDFQEVAGARRLAELVDAGVPVREIQSSLARLETVIGVGSRPLAQLDILASDKHLLYRDARGNLKTAAGQRLFDFDASSPSAAPADELLPLPIPEAPTRHNWTARDWFEEGRRLADDGLLASAIEAFRMSLMDEHDAPEVQFHLAEALYRQGSVPAALERYQIAAELDHNYLEAWTQIGCLLAELGRLTEAIDAFDIAIDIHPNYPDAHLHKAESLHQAGQTAAAMPHWQKYLEFDQSGPWAEAARKRLEEAARGT